MPAWQLLRLVMTTTELLLALHVGGHFGTFDAAGRLVVGCCLLTLAEVRKVPLPALLVACSLGRLLFAGGHLVAFDCLVFCDLVDVLADLSSHTSHLAACLFVSLLAVCFIVSSRPGTFLAHSPDVLSIWSGFSKLMRITDGPSLVGLRVVELAARLPYLAVLPGENADLLHGC
jgi:hypothetical protein